MTIAPSGNAIGVQDAGTDPTITTQTTYIDSSLTSGSTTLEFRIGIYHANPFGTGNTFGYDGLGGTLYGFAQTFSGGTQFGGWGGDIYNTNAQTGSLGSGDTRASNGYTLYGPFNWPMKNWIPGGVTYTAISPGRYVSAGTYGSIGSASNKTWTSDSGESYEISQLLWFRNTRTTGTFSNTGNPNTFGGTHKAGSDDSNYIIFSFRRTSGTPSNPGPAFGELNIGGLTLKPEISGVQSASHSVNVNGTSGYNQTFAWYGLTDSQITNIGSTGSVDFELKGVSVTQTYNNGIAEEFGGADSADVKMSDYYKNGALVTSNVTASIPTEGEISVSDFQGATYAAAGFFTTTFNADTASQQLYTSTFLQVSGYRDTSAGSFTDGARTHTGSGESSLKPTLSFTSQANFLGLTARTFNVTQLAVNSFESANSFNYSSGYDYDNFFFTVTTAGDVSSSATNTGWTDIRVWTGSDTYSSPTLLLTRANTSITVSQYSSTNNITTIAIGATQSQVGGGLKSGLTAGDYADLFGTSSTASSNPQWNFAIT